MPDFVLIEELNVSAKIGWLPDERVTRQQVQLNFEIEIDGEVAATSGDLNDTVCYKTVTEKVEALVLTKEWRLLEELGIEIIRMIFLDFKPATRVTLELRKFVLPQTKWVGVRISRERGVI